MKKNLDIKTDKSYCSVCHNTGQVLDFSKRNTIVVEGCEWCKGWDRKSKTGDQ